MWPVRVDGGASEWWLMGVASACGLVSGVDGCGQ